MKTSIKLALTLAISTALTGAADAAVFSKSYVLTSTDFTSDRGATPPYQNVVQRFTITFDPAGTVAPTYSNYSSNTNGAFSFLGDSRNYRLAGNVIYFGIDTDGYGDGYFSQFATDLQGNAVSAFSTVYFTGNNFFNSRSTTFSVQTAAPAIPVGSVPEPTTWAMMITGFGLVGGTMRRRRTTIAFA